MNRIYIYPKDLVILTGRSENACRIEFNNALAVFGKRKFLTFEEWCEYNGDKIEIIKKALKIK